MPQAIHYGVSVTNDGFFGSGTSTGSNVSDDGRYVVFKSEANDLVPGDTNQRSDVFRHDLTTGVVEIVSLGVDGFGSWNPDVSSDGRFVVWESDSTNHVPGDTNGTWDVFLRDMELGVTERLSLTGTGAEADNQSQWARITPDARYVVFQSLAALVPTDTNGHWDVYRLDRQLNELVIVSVDAADGQGNSRSSEPDISHDGQRIAFASSADNMVAGDTSGNADAFAKDASTGAIEWLNVRPNGNQANGYVSASMDGNLVAFAAWAENLVGNDTNGAQDIFIRDRAAGTTRRVNLSMTGAELDDHSFYPAMTSDARFLTYASVASNVLAGDTMGHFQIYAVDRFASGSVGESYCFAHPNSTGVGSELAATGTSVGTSDRAKCRTLAPLAGST